MYHDQAHVPAKAIGRFKPATILLGLPHVRTSVAHGTVYGKAALGSADATGMIYACQLAAEACQTARRQQLAKAS
jgi:4-hydroxy-L-threonine phosphate dehydrogenase PdxA